MKKVFSFAAAFFIFVLSGCSTATKFDYFTSTINTKTDIDNTLIADDIFAFMSRYYLPNKTNLYITTSDFNKKFYNYLVQKFRDKGYAVTDDSTLKNLTFLSYSIKGDASLIFVTYNINDSKINRLYTVQDDRLVRAGEITVFNFLLQEPIAETPSVRVSEVKPQSTAFFLAPKEPLKEEQKEIIADKSKPAAKTPIKKTISSLELKKQKPFVPASTPKESKIPLAIGEDGKPFVEPDTKVKEVIVAPQEPQKETKAPLARVEEVKPIETPKIDQNVSVTKNENAQNTQAQNTKPVEINATANKSIEAHDTSIATDKNVSVEQKVTAMIEELKSTPLSEAEAALKSSTRVDVTLKSDVNNSKNTNETLTKTDTNNTKLAAKTPIETVAIADRPFDTNTSANAPARSELNLIETIEEALGVYPDINEEKLRADLMREVVKYPHIDAQAVKTMPLKKGLLLQLLKVAKEKQP